MNHLTAITRIMPEIALHDVQRDTGVEQGCGLGVAESVSPLEIHQCAGAVANVEPEDQFTDPLSQPPIRVGPVAVTVLPAGDEQVLRRRCVRFGTGTPHPVLLRVDDRDDFPIDQDGVGSAVDLGLLVTEPGNERLRIVRGAGPGLMQRQQRIVVEHADLADPSSGACQQHQDAHRLLVTEPAVGGRCAEQPGAGHDLGERVCVDDVTLMAAMS